MPAVISIPYVCSAVHQAHTFTYEAGAKPTSKKYLLKTNKSYYLKVMSAETIELPDKQP